MQLWLGYERQSAVAGFQPPEAKVLKLEVKFSKKIGKLKTNNEVLELDDNENVRIKN